MNKLLYDDIDTDIATILRDVDIDKDMTNYMAHDKMMHTNTLNYIITHMNIHDASNTIIINHSINNTMGTTYSDTDNAIITAYANKYKPLYNNIISNINHDNFIEALLNGMYVIRINQHWGNYDFTATIENYMKMYPKMITLLMRNLRGLYIYECTDAVLSKCESITELNIFCGTATTCEPFAKSLKKLYVDFGTESENDITDDGLSKCTNIEVLHASGNNKITKCDAFSQTLRELCVSWDNIYCTIDDYGIRLCRNIEKLYAHYNELITTCEPFSKTLKTLSASGLCGISDDGLRKCIAIECLDVSRNMKITTCEPFARTLRHLIATNRCGITNERLRICRSIEILIVDDNDKITTCDPFAKLLRVLSVRKNICGIGDVGLRLCKNIRYMFADGNDGITSCKLFAKSLRMISAGGSCGICDEELKLCPNIKDVYACGNPRINMGQMDLYKMCECRSRYCRLN